MSRSHDPRPPRRWDGGARGWDSHPGLLQLPRPGTAKERRVWRSEHRFVRNKGRLIAANRRDQRRVSTLRWLWSAGWWEDERRIGSPETSDSDLG